jgi:hypothetical protein
MWTDLVPHLSTKDPEVQAALAKLDFRGWLSIYYASAAYIALVQHDGTAAGFYRTCLHNIEDSRSKAIALAVFNTLLDEWMVEHGIKSADQADEYFGPVPGAAQDHGGLRVSDRPSEGDCGRSRWRAASHMLGWWRALWKVRCTCEGSSRQSHQP